MASIRQLASILGVSTSTISLALRDDPRVRPEMRQRIQELAATYHYRPNRLTQSIISGKSNTLGCILPTVAFTFYSRLLRGVLTEAFEQSYRTIILETNSDPIRIRKAIHTLIEQRVDLILIANERLEPITRESMLEMRGHGIVPVGLDSTQFESPVDEVRTDEEQLAETAVSYLYNMGHRQIFFVGRLPSKRLAGRPLAMFHALRKRGLSADNIIDIDEGSDVAAIFDRLLNAKPSPTAIITLSDRIAAKMMQCAGKYGLSVPRDISFLGCANLEIAELLTPPLTSIEQQPEDVGVHAVRLGLKRLAEIADEGPYQTEKILVPVRLIKRATCAPPRRLF